jgi:hypothetical protein
MWRRHLGRDFAGALFAIGVLQIYFGGSVAGLWDLIVACVGLSVGSLLGRLFGRLFGTQGTI